MYICTTELEIMRMNMMLKCLVNSMLVKFSIAIKCTYVVQEKFIVKFLLVM